MKRRTLPRHLPWLVAAGLAMAGLSGCSTISNALDAMNPFASSGPKMSPLPEIKEAVSSRSLWSQSVGSADGYVFSPAEAGGAVFAADRKGQLYRFEEGKLSWKINVGRPLSAGVGADRQIVVVGTAKGDVLATARIAATTSTVATALPPMTAAGAAGKTFSSSM